MQKQAGTLTLFWTRVSGDHDLNAYLQLLKLDGIHDAGRRARKTGAYCCVQFVDGTKESGGISYRRRPRNAGDAGFLRGK